jgi:hypothetical protein
MADLLFFCLVQRILETAGAFLFVLKKIMRSLCAIAELVDSSTSNDDKVRRH